MDDLAAFTERFYSVDQAGDEGLRSMGAARDVKDKGTQMTEGVRALRACSAGGISFQEFMFFGIFKMGLFLREV